MLPGRGSVVAVEEREKQAEVELRAVFLGHKDPYPSFGAPASVLKVGLIHDFVVRGMDRDLPGSDESNRGRGSRHESLTCLKSSLAIKWKIYVLEHIGEILEHEGEP